MSLHISFIHYGEYVHTKFLIEAMIRDRMNKNQDYLELHASILLQVLCATIGIDFLDLVLGSLVIRFLVSEIQMCIHANTLVEVT